MFERTATREILGIISLSSSSRLPPNSRGMEDNPVTFPRVGQVHPRRPTKVSMIGMFLVSCRAAWVARGLVDTTMSTFAATS